MQSITMADATTLYSLISGIGGALIGGIAGVYGPGRIDRRRRQHERELEAERRRHERDSERQRQELDAAADSLTSIAEAITCLHAWLRLVEWSLQDLEAGRSIDITRFDEQADQALQSVTRAVNLLANSRFHAAPQTEETGGGHPLSRLLHEIAAKLRSQILEPRSDFDGRQIHALATAVQEALSLLLTAEREAITRQPSVRVRLRAEDASVQAIHLGGLR